MDAENKEAIDEEAIAEEEFVSDLEDTIENPLVYDGDKLTVQSKKTQEEGEKKEELAGAIGSGELVVNTPFNNEEALRSESMNNGDNPFGSDSTTNKGFDGPDKAPLDDATETIAPSATTGEEEAPSATETTESEPAESAPVAESESTSTPALGEDTNESAATSSETPVVSNAPTTENSTDNAAEPKKKKKTGLIVGIIIAVLLVGAAIGGVVFYMIHESKEQTVLDAVTNLIGGGSQQLGSSVKTDARQFDGTIKMSAMKKEDMDGLKSMSLTFKADTKASNFSGTGSLEFELTTNQTIKVDLSGAYISGDGIYFKADKLKDALNTDLLFGADTSGGYGSSSMSDLNSIIKDIVSSVIEAVDGKWFKIDANTFADDKDSQESYSCVTKALDDLSSKEVKDKVAAIYKSHPFIENDDKDTSDADGLKYYSVKTSSDKYQAFVGEVKELSAVKDLKTCMNNSASSSDSESEKVTAEIKLGITGWSHELKVIKGNVKSDSTNMDIDVKVGYEEKSVVAPTDSAKSLEDLTKDFMNSFANSPYMKSYITSMAKQSCAGYASNINTYNKCVEEITEKLMAEMMKGMMGQFVPSATKTSALIQ